MTKELYGKDKPAILIKAALDLIHPDGTVFEVRIPKSRAGTISGYFNDKAVAAALIAKENGKHQAIYVTMNPVKPALVARNENKFEYGSHTTTNDAEIESRRWFLLDFDPVRPAGISSTDGEIAMARDLAKIVIEWLTSIGWPEPIIADSGNGVHVMYRVDLPNDDSSRVNFEFATKMLSSLFSTDKVLVDTTSFNAARVWKVYGTISAKGSSTEERPHRVAMLTKVPKTLTLVSGDQLDTLARPLRDAKSDEFKDMTGEYIPDMVKWLSDRGITVTSGPRPMFGNEGQKWLISKCPFNPEHQSPMVGLVNNRPVYRCLHNSCSGFRWKEFREKVDPNFKDPDTVKQRLIEWCNGAEPTVPGELAQSACATQRKLEPMMKQIRKDVPRERFLLLEEAIKAEKRRFIRETIGENNEKGNIVGLINRTRMMQQEGIVPMYWIADFDHRIRVGTVGDIDCPKASEEDEITLMIRFHGVGDSWVKQTHTSQIIKALASEYKVNPLRAMLKARTWDGIKRVDNWLTRYMAVVDTEYSRAVGRKWLISAVARGMEPGCQADHMLIFEGQQGIGKSRALRALGGRFYTEFSASAKGINAQRDMTAVIIGKMIVELSELATIRKAEIEYLKAMLTTTCDDVRLSYERDAKSYPRTCVFAGTTNEIKTAYIADQTGARRFWPVHCGEIGPLDIDALVRDADQIWAEATEAYESGEDWWTTPAELVSAEQADRQMLLEDTEPWFGKIRSALTDPESYDQIFHPVQSYTDGQPDTWFNIRAAPAHVVLGVLLGIDTARQTAMDVQRLQKVLRGIGFAKVRPSRGWFGNTYAYELRKSTLPHLWSSIEAAKNARPFPKSGSRQNEDQA